MAVSALVLVATGCPSSGPNQKTVSLTFTGDDMVGAALRVPTPIEGYQFDHVERRDGRHMTIYYRRVGYTGSIASVDSGAQESGN